MRRTVATLALAVVLLMPSVSMAAQSSQAYRTPWWQALMDWVVLTSGEVVKSVVEVVIPDETDDPRTNASTTIDPIGQPG